jgi:hypothetical protein
MEEDNEISPDITRLELRHLRQSMDGLKSSVDKVLDDHEKRIRQLNDARMYMIGAAVMCGALGGLLFKILFK